MTRALRVATWNLHEGVPATKAGSWAVPRASVGEPFAVSHSGETDATIVDLVNDLGLDIVGLQEVPFNLRSEAPTIAEICQGTDLKHATTHALSPSSFHSGALAGVAVVSRFPLRDCVRFRLPNPRLSNDCGEIQISSHDKGMVSAVASVHGMEISVTSLHMLPFHIFGRAADEDVFQHIWSGLNRQLARLSNRPQIVCGDFNTPQRDLVRVDRLVLSSAVGNIPTYEDQAIDDILYTPPFRALKTTTEVTFSDHSLCVTELDIA